jgi:hypothetical protein
MQWQELASGLAAPRFSYDSFTSVQVVAGWKMVEQQPGRPVERHWRPSKNHSPRFLKCHTQNAEITTQAAAKGMLLEIIAS